MLEWSAPGNNPWITSACGRYRVLYVRTSAETGAFSAIRLGKTGVADSHLLATVPNVPVKDEEARAKARDDMKAACDADATAGAGGGSASTPG
jgi:hypothetical protein